MAEDDSLNISSRTMLAVRSRHKALSLFSPGKEQEVSDPMGLPQMLAKPLCLRRVECISRFSAVTP